MLAAQQWTGQVVAEIKTRQARSERDRLRLLVETLANFGVDATIVGTIAGPRVVRYELRLAPGTKPDTTSRPSPCCGATVTAALPWMVTTSSPAPGSTTALEKEPS